MGSCCNVLQIHRNDVVPNPPEQQLRQADHTATSAQSRICNVTERTRRVILLTHLDVFGMDL
jgi:hypothetical protein